MPLSAFGFTYTGSFLPAAVLHQFEKNWNHHVLQEPAQSLLEFRKAKLTKGDSFYYVSGRRGTLRYNFYYTKISQKTK